ncbi:MAG TPA: outer membrane beta-barrel protein [Kofleriaceae bacterium]|nr:outer membrane beta-barrel protein [Kofleriaceae bacterium]
MTSKTLAALLLVASSTTAAFADDYELGARVGGYGFRRQDADGQWDVCRMNGFGVFGGRALRGPLFVEAGIDMYSSIGAAQPTDLPIDRTSGLFSGAIGARTQLATWLRGYVQLGGGVELTRVSVPYGDDHIRDEKAMPEGFFGLGFDIKLAKHTLVGSSFRTLLMGNFDYDPANLEMKDQWAWKPTPDVVFDASPDVATQVQFYVRHEL